jgi:hypothetical protein
MGALAHTVDLPARVKDRVLDAKGTVHAKVEAVGQRLHRGTETLQDKADEAASEAKSLTNQAVARLASPAGGRVKQLTETLRQRPVLAVVAVVLSVVVVLRRLLRSTS